MAFTYSKLTIERLEQGVKICVELAIETADVWCL